MFEYDDTYVIKFWGDGATLEVVNTAVKEIIHSLRDSGAAKADLQAKEYGGREGDDFEGTVCIAFNRPDKWDDKYGTNMAQDGVDPDAKFMELVDIFESSSLEALEYSEVDFDVYNADCFEVYVPSYF